MKQILLIGLTILGLMPTNLLAQPTLTRVNNFPEANTSWDRTACEIEGVTAGEAGENVTWDFTYLVQSTTILGGNFVFPAQSTFPDLFPAANLVEDFGDGNATFYQANADSVAVVGFTVATEPGQAFPITLSNPQVNMQYPFTFGDSFIDEGARAYGTLTGTITNLVQADAYGTVILPSGTFTNALRVHSVINTEDSDETGNVIFSISDDLYEWYIEDHVEPILTIRYRTTIDNGVSTESAAVNFTNIQAKQGGPDNYGYSWERNTNNCDWMDITAIGTEITGLADDNFVGPFDLGFDFQYYWSTVNDIYIGSNGYVSFDPAQISSTAIGFPYLPTADGQNHFLAPFLGDLSFSGNGNTGKVYTYTDNASLFVISFIDVPFWENNADGFSGSNTFQVILSAQDSSVTFNYLATETEVVPSYQGRPNPLVIGIENISGEIGLQVSSDLVNLSNSCLTFRPPSEPLIEVIDVFPAWSNNESNGGSFLFKGAITDLTTNVKNVGSVAINNDITINASVFNSENVAFIETSTTTISGLDKGESQEVVTIPTFPAITEDTYTYIVNVATDNDINPNNNLQTNEIVVVDSIENGEIALDYTHSDPTGTNAVSWTGGANFDDGVAVYIKPPIYPVEIIGIEYFLVATDGGDLTTGCKGEILAANSPTQHGEVLTSKTLASTELTTGWNRVVFPETVTITEGGFFASWLMESTGIGLGTDPTPPYSNRNFEILDGAWSPYRSNNTTDIYLRAIIKKANDDLVGVQIKENISSLQIGDAYPNPSATNFRINYSIPTNQTALFTITNSLGQVVTQRKLPSTNNQNKQLLIIGNNLPIGNYFYTIKTANKMISKQFTIIR